jgi:F-type H+-transporting ATPase subunit delta
LSNARLSKRYARALFDLGQQDGSYVQYGHELDALAGLYKDNADFRDAVTSPVFAMDAKKRILNAVLNKGGFSQIARNFFNLLLDKNRIGSINSINEYYSRLADDVSNISHAEIVTAIPLKKETLDRVVKTFEGLISRTIRAKLIQDPDIIGGIIVKIGDTYWDGSIRAQIEGLRESFRRGE